jgi:hypothetical protein
MSALFEARATKERVLHLHKCAEYVFSLRIRETKRSYILRFQIILFDFFILFKKNCRYEQTINYLHQNQNGKVRYRYGSRSVKGASSPFGGVILASAFVHPAVSN